jgi:hypothetical protein
MVVQNGAQQGFCQGLGRGGKNLDGGETCGLGPGASLSQIGMENKGTFGCQGHQTDGHGWAHGGIRWE